MKMRKLLASAVAASVAVTSLATVASAADKSWNMGHTTGTIEFAGTTGIELGDEFLLDDEAFETGASTLGVSAADSITVKAAVTDWDLTGVSLVITGVKGTRGAAVKTYEHAFKSNDNGTYTLDVFAGTAEIGGFLPEQYLEMTKCEIKISGKRVVDNAADYDANSWGTWVNYNTLTIVEDFAQDALILNEIADLVVDLEGNSTNGGNEWGFCANATSATTTITYPFMPVTSKDGDDILGRNEIRPLSVTGDYDSIDREGDKDGNNANQSYDGDNTVDGQVKKDFAGLASQAADFFNKQTNGTITFKFTTGAAAGGTAWENGGIPSTQTGIKNFMGDATANDFALFINYKQTGSLQAITELDADAGTVTFDISDILDAMGGQTLGTLDNIYYGLRKGVTYKDIGTGLLVESVTFSYDEDADVEADIEDEEEDVEIEEDDDVEIEEDDDVEIEEEDDDVAVEDDAETDGDVIVETEDDDANPGTGVALAVVPAMVAAAAVVLSKKRK